MHYNDFARSVTRVVLVVVAVMINANQLAVAQVDSSSSNPVVSERLPAMPLEATESVEAIVPPIPAPDVDPNGAGDANAAASLDLGYSVLMQGPVHEAFAAPTASDAFEGSRIYSVAPPQPIQEKPPANTQAGDETIIWISGYWAWSDEANKYVWVSGLYRKPPPGRTWVAGYWSESASGYRWTSGYWSGGNASTEIAQSLPVPPASIDNGPSIPPPGEDYFWLPGQWEYAAEQYQWRSGYWTTHHEGWVWQPACYMNTPAGFLYVDGYWDALPTQRGQLYVPVDFYDSVIDQPGYVYQPQYPLATPTDLLLHLFTRPSCPHYFYGDYYGPNDALLGYRPWYDNGYGRGAQVGINSLWLGYYDWNYRRSGIDFVGSMMRYNDFYRANPQQRPPKGFKNHPHAKGQPVFPPDFPASKSKESHHSLDEMIQRQVGGKPVKRISEKSHGKSSTAQPFKAMILAPPNKKESGYSGIKPAKQSKVDSSPNWDRGKSNGNSGKNPSRVGAKPSGGKGNGKNK